MTREEFLRLYPLLRQWIDSTLARHASRSAPVARAGFTGLSLCFSPDFLARARYVCVPEVPVPPLGAMGLGRFAEFEELAAAGITYLDTYFVRKDHQLSERLHFHELIHVVQWQVLGAEGFLATYAEGLERHGYRASPLEEMAYEAEAAFAGGARFDAETWTRKKLQALASRAG